MGRPLVDYKQPLRYVELARAAPEVLFRMVDVPTNETPPELREALEEAAAELPNLELLGSRPRERLLPLIGASCAIVSTSRYEGMPNVFLEAWARKVPVLTLDFDPDDLVEVNELGIAAKGEFGRFVEGARSLWNHPELRTRLGENGRAYVRSAHDFEVVSGLWEALVRRGLEKTR